jgi:hypothetical protein
MIPPVTDGRILPEISSNEERVKPASADDWSREKVCVGNYCLFVNVEYDQPTSSFQDPDNCIACHMEKINDTIKDLISHSMNPSKITGNPLEAPKCKNGLALSLSAVSMNINVQFMPIKTPLNDELIFNSDLANDWKYFCDATAFFPAETCVVGPERPVEVDTPPLTSVLQRELIYAEEGITHTQLIERIDSALASKLAPPAENAAKLDNDKSINPVIDMYKAVAAEMDQMNLFFVNFRNIFISLHKEVKGMPGTTACVQLKNKETCT